MSLKERIYSVLVVSSAEKLNSALVSVLPESRYSPLVFVANVSAAKRMWAERSFDFLIINSPLPDSDGTRFAIDAAGSSGCSVMIMVRAELYTDIYDKLIDHGVFILAKPLSRTVLLSSLDWMAGTRERLRRLEKKTLSVEEKMQEIRLINRAKWFLITELSMDEPQAHRHIEKQAMDRCISKTAVAEEIIRKYS